MTRIGKAELHHGEHRTIAEELRRIDAVTASQVTELAREVLRRPITAAVAGPYAQAEELPGEVTELIA
jgi:predicted Zn-dependent peptidase